MNQDTKKISDINNLYYNFYFVDCPFIQKDVSKPINKLGRYKNVYGYIGKKNILKFVNLKKCKEGKLNHILPIRIGVQDTTLQNQLVSALNMLDITNITITEKQKKEKPLQYLDRLINNIEKEKKIIIHRIVQDLGEIDSEEQEGKLYFPYEDEQEKLNMFIYIIIQNNKSISIEPIIFVDCKQLSYKSSLKYEDELYIQFVKNETNEQLETYFNTFMNKHFNKGIKSYLFTKNLYDGLIKTNDRDILKGNVSSEIKEYKQFIKNCIHFGIKWDWMFHIDKSPIQLFNKIKERIIRNIYLQMKRLIINEKFIIHFPKDLNIYIPKPSITYKPSNDNIPYNVNDLGIKLRYIEIEEEKFLLGEPYYDNKEYYQNIYYESGLLYGKIPYIDKLKTPIEDNKITKDISYCQ